MSKHKCQTHELWLLKHRVMQYKVFKHYIVPIHLSGVPVKMNFSSQILEHPSIGEYGNISGVPYRLKMWYLCSSESASVIQKLTTLECKNGLVLSNTHVPVSEILKYTYFAAPNNITLISAIHSAEVWWAHTRSLDTDSIIQAWRQAFYSCIWDMYGHE